MPTVNANEPHLPTLPQQVTAAEREQRQFQLALARTSYNYMFSYLEPLPLSADLPKGEEFTPDYEFKVLQVFIPLAENFVKVVVRLLKEELEDDVSGQAVRAVEESFEKLKGGESLLHLGRDIVNLEAFVESLAALPKALTDAGRIAEDIAKMATGLKQVFEDFKRDGPTAFLKSTLFEMLNTSHGRDYLEAGSLQDYRKLFDSLPQPMMLTLKQQPWMPTTGDLPCEQDWFFGWLQVGGFNTTNLRGVVLERPTEAGSKAVVLGELQQKFPITDSILQGVVGDNRITLREAAQQNRLFVCDYAQLDGTTADILQGKQRYIAAPIALFYWNPKPPQGYPPSGYGPQAAGVLQPVAIQLAQKHDPETAPIFTPNDCAGANDANHLKWKVAKYFVNVVCAIQHESVAHLGDCHMTIEPMVVAARRQLANQHPLLTLLIPHFRFTLNINDSAIHSLIVPGGVVATNVGPSIEGALQLVATAHAAWRWDENHPDNVFRLRGVDKLPVFPFRDDTKLLWQATHEYVDAYLRLYYTRDQDVQHDGELQAWVNEMVIPKYAGFQGLKGLTPTGDPKNPVKLDSLAYLIEMVAQIIYIAGPQHASVNYAQYPLMSYMPSVAGTIYQAPPTRSTVLKTPEDCIAWYPPLDVSLYTFSFEYLLSGVQYDTFGYYADTPRTPYFADKRVQKVVATLQDRLALAEIEIRKRNKDRPMAYPFQLPSQIPNSISI